MILTIKGNVLAKMAINAPIQGTQADIIKIAMVQITEMLKQENAVQDAHMLLQVHDELVFEIVESRVQELAKKIQEIMESVVPVDQTLGIPLLVQPKVGKDWGDMHLIV